MAEHSRRLPRPLSQRDLNWDPFRDWAQPSRIFDQEFGLPPFLEEGDLNWIDWARRRLSSSWPAYLRSPLFAPYSFYEQGASSPNLQRQLCGGVSEVRTGPDCWKISLDVNHFSPEEITIKIKEGYLEIAGKHEERQDEHGFVSRCFTRKYKIPSSVDPQNISSSLSPSGILSVEAPLPQQADGAPVEIVIPVQVERKKEAQKEEDEAEGEDRGHLQPTEETEAQQYADTVPGARADLEHEHESALQENANQKPQPHSGQQGAPFGSEEGVPVQSEQGATSEEPVVQTGLQQGVTEEPVMETPATPEEPPIEGPQQDPVKPQDSLCSGQVVSEKQDTEQPEEVKERTQHS
nr:PREDICTED: heat shock protein beta-1-like [Lepisosteus oculatus]